MLSLLHLRFCTFDLSSVALIYLFCSVEPKRKHLDRQYFFIILNDLQRQLTSQKTKVHNMHAIHESLKPDTGFTLFIIASVAI